MKCLHCGEFIAGEITKIVSKIYFSPSFVVMLFCYSVRFSFVVWIIFLGISLQRPGGTILLRIFERVFLDLQFFFFFSPLQNTFRKHSCLYQHIKQSSCGACQIPVTNCDYEWHRVDPSVAVAQAHKYTQKPGLSLWLTSARTHTHTQTHSHDF